MTSPSDPAIHAGPNPIGDSFNISVLVPEEITIRMVDASALADYEIWFFISSLLASSFVGFLIPCMQAHEVDAATATVLLWITVLVGAMFIISFIMALAKRRSLRKKGRSMKLKTSQA